jgi:hypothetical protein
MIEAWWRSLKHQWLFLHSLDSVTTFRRFVEFTVQEHNRALPHSAFRGQTPDEMYFGTGDAVPADLTARVLNLKRPLNGSVRARLSPTRRCRCCCRAASPGRKRERRRARNTVVYRALPIQPTAAGDLQPTGRGSRRS